MVKVKLYDIVSSMNEVYGLTRYDLVVSKQKQVMLEVHCNMIDALSEIIGGEEYSVELSDDMKRVTLSVLCSNVTVKDDEQQMSNLMRYAYTTKIGSVGDGKILISFTFDSVWE